MRALPWAVLFRRFAAALISANRAASPTTKLSSTSASSPPTPAGVGGEDAEVDESFVVGEAARFAEISAAAKRRNNTAQGNALIVLHKLWICVWEIGRASRRERV